MREFAAGKGLTYSIALGTPAERQQVPDFRGYPTMLFFKKGLAFDHLDVGVGPGFKENLEVWIRDALGLPPEDGARPRAEPTDVARAPANNDPPPLPQGVIFKPGDGDKGFDFDVVDSDGQALAFKDLRGKPVILALTSTWDAEAEKTAQILQRLQEHFADQQVPVLAASLEIEKQDAAKVAKINKFKTDHELTYRVFPAGLGFQKKIHLFSGMPLFLVFDGEGVLVLRKSGTSEDTESAVQTAAENAK